MLGGFTERNIYWGVCLYVIILVGIKQIKEYSYAYDIWTPLEKRKVL